MSTFEAFLNKAMNPDEDLIDREAEAVEAIIEAELLVNRQLLALAAQTLEQAMMEEERIKARLEYARAAARYK